MPPLFDLLYREYCRSRLAEMRRQFWLANSKVPGDSDQAAADRFNDSIGARHEAEAISDAGASNAWPR